MSEIIVQGGMSKPTAQQIIDGTGISRTHAYDILSGRADPSLELALQIHRSTQWRHPTIATLAATTLADLEASKPWERAA